MTNPTPPSYHVEREPARGRRRILIAAIVAVVLLAGSGAAYAATRGGSQHRSASRHTLFINGHITAEPSTFMWSYHAAHPYARNGCSPDTGYKDLPGAEVTVADEAGRTLAVAHLDQGTWVTDVCSYAFTITGVPAGRKFYKLTIGRRGTLTYTEAQLSAGPLDLKLD